MAEPPLSEHNTFSRYGAHWEQFYRALDPHGKAQPLWDVPAEFASAQDHTQFGPCLDPELPLVDLGCGTGTQTAFLARHYPRTIGLDVSPTAIERARTAHRRAGLSFAVLADPAVDLQRLHRELGDCNVYIRGVLHQVECDELPAYSDALLTLMGARGALYVIEVADHIRDYLAQGGTGFSRLPAAMKRTLTSNLPPRGFSLRTLLQAFPPARFQVLQSGETVLNTNIRFGREDPICIPAVFALLRPASAPEGETA